MIAIQKKTGPVSGADFSIFPTASPCLFFDIETTGLSGEKNMIYLVGALLLTPESGQDRKSTRLNSSH